MFELPKFTFKNLDDFIYFQKVNKKPIIGFDKLSDLAHESHASIIRRYRKFLKYKRSDDITINKRRANRCCRMVKTHLENLKEVKLYMIKNNLQAKHPIFLTKLDKWIDECNGIYVKYHKQVKLL